MVLQNFTRFDVQLYTQISKCYFMKELFFIVVAATIAVLPACGQKLKESQVPALAKTSFQKKYPGVKGSWDKEDDNYEVNFKQDGKAMSAVIDKNGTIVETETDIPVTDLPRAVRDYMKAHYAGVKVKEAAKIVKANGDVNYEAEVNHKDVIFDVNGKFIKEAKD
ncbi:MAG: hypothetical protein E6H10_02735 [Bacteroidetes bacterium]|nr:MAG: hypothetical protein E6H10_02735 [Bacteroidota bacterium]